jgi:predicted transglutaminase-like protease
MKLLKEIANLEPYPYTVSKAGAEFLDKAGNRIGVIFEFFDLDLPTRAIKVVNIAFGVLKVDQKNAIENIDQSLTNAGDARRVISTVGEIIVSNKRVQEEADCIVLAGSDKAKERRQQIYAIATQDIINKLPRFKDRKYFKITFTGGAMGIVSLALDLTAAETEFIKTHLQVNK